MSDPTSTKLFDAAMLKTMHERITKAEAERDAAIARADALVTTAAKAYRDGHIVGEARATAAIVASEPPESYDPKRAVGTETARGFATGHGIRLAQAGEAGPETTSYQSKQAKIIEDRATRMINHDGQNRRHKRHLDYLQGTTLVAIVCVFVIAFAGYLFL